MEVWTTAWVLVLCLVGFEGFNKVIKKGTKRANFNNESESCMKWYSMCLSRSCTCV